MRGEAAERENQAGRVRRGGRTRLEESKLRELNFLLVKHNPLEERLGNRVEDDDTK